MTMCILKTHFVEYLTKEKCLDNETSTTNRIIYEEYCNQNITQKMSHQL